MKARWLGLVIWLPLAAAAERDEFTGLTKAPGWELVRAHCGSCHSYQLITQQRGDAAFWRSTIRWMQQTQNLWPIPKDQESAIVDYLAQHYAGQPWGRRPALSSELMPPRSKGSTTATGSPAAPPEPVR